MEVSVSSRSAPSREPIAKIASKAAAATPPMYPIDRIFSVTALREMSSPLFTALKKA